MSCARDIHSLGLVLVLVLVLVLGACNQKMRDQGYREPLESSEFFADGAASRTLPPGTIPDGQLRVRFEPPATPTRAMLERGRREYAIHCTPCHGRLGAGDGMVARQGFPRPEPLWTPRLIAASDRHLYEVITHGRGVMYGYAEWLDANERWAIAQWIRVLQLSQHAPVAALEPRDRARLDRKEGPT